MSLVSSLRGCAQELRQPPVFHSTGSQKTTGCWRKTTGCTEKRQGAGGKRQGAQKNDRVLCRFGLTRTLAVPVGYKDKLKYRQHKHASSQPEATIIGHYGHTGNRLSPFKLPYIVASGELLAHLCYLYLSSPFIATSHNHCTINIILV